MSVCSRDPNTQQQQLVPTLSFGTCCNERAQYLFELQPAAACGLQCKTIQQCCVQLSFEIGIEDSCVLPTNLSRLLNTFSAQPNFYSTPHQTPPSRSCRVASRLKGLTRREKVKRGRNAVLTLLPITRSTFKRSGSKSTKTIYIALPNYVFKLICQN